MTETIDTAQPEALRLAQGLADGHCSLQGWMWPAAAELRRLHAALAAAEARNATLTDDAAHADRYAEQLGRELAAATAENAAQAQQIARQTNKLDALLAHCPEGECWTCSTIICPHACELHFHHDGCPACAEHDAAASISTKGDGPGCTCQGSGGPDYCERHAP